MPDDMQLTFDIGDDAQFKAFVVQKLGRIEQQLETMHMSPCASLVTISAKVEKHDKLYNNAMLVGTPLYLIGTGAIAWLVKRFFS